MLQNNDTKIYIEYNNQDYMRNISDNIILWILYRN